MSESAEKDALYCACPKPSHTGLGTCSTCGKFACEYANAGQTRCPSWRCDCFIETHPDSPRDLHPEDFIVGSLASVQERDCSCGHAEHQHDREAIPSLCLTCGDRDGCDLFGCDCSALCSMGPTCPGGILAGLPDAGCHRTIASGQPS